MRSSPVSPLTLATVAAVALAALATALGGGQVAAAGVKPAKRPAATFNGVPIEDLGGKAARPALKNALPAGSLRTEVKVAAGSIGAADGRLAVITAGKRVSLRNGGRIELADGLAAELFLSPYPPGRTRAWLDVHLFHAKTGAAVTDAVGDMSYDMSIMTMGRFSGTARNTGDGHYLYTADYAMYGDWTHTLHLRVGRVVYEVTVQVAALPGV